MNSFVFISVPPPVNIGQQTEKRLDMLGGARCPTVVSLAQDVEGGQHVEDEDWRPAEEEEKHDEDQHVDDLLGLLLSYQKHFRGRTLNIFVVCLVMIVLMYKEELGFF